MNNWVSCRTLRHYRAERGYHFWQHTRRGPKIFPKSFRSTWWWCGQLSYLWISGPLCLSTPMWIIAHLRVFCARFDTLCTLELSRDSHPLEVEQTYLINTHRFMSTVIDSRTTEAVVILSILTLRIKDLGRLTLHHFFTLLCFKVYFLMRF